MATYNMARYLPLAVRSILDQTHQALEVHVVDDGSTDATGSVIEPLLADGRVRLHRQRNRGQAAAKNRGVRESTGEYIAFLDADDLWEPRKLEAQLPLFVGTAAPGVVYARMRYIDEEGRPLDVNRERLCRGWLSGELLIRNFIGFGTTVIRRECFERLGDFRESLAMGIDYDLWLRFSTRYAFDFVDEPLLRYRLWPGQMSNNCRARYASGIAIMTAFLRDFPERVDRRTQDEAWAHTYTGLGDCLRQCGARRREVLATYARALRHRPVYLRAWRALASTLVR